ncbi:conserved hypothetical protein [Gloeothece citriformis PCC 7424]|uniref:Pvc16 N-terminal domain-containing protein n=1 Tax=Gloeothece citriformis (strain PCC 7424) TaxID=65393 RepID=B7KJB1_GLOC7|nr:DUF4255 domain-containing protein [Gloeothece citriformis]ACK72195.1 conserved hypothetical protein [Gloeothece citriformis PCC 7424]
MSNYLAIASVTATLQKILQSTIQDDVEGARVTTIRPDGVGRSTPETGVNLYLYRVSPVNWRHGDLPSRRSTGDLIKRPQIALDLNYILTFYGNEVELEPQRLLGSVVRTLHSRPILTSEIIRDAMEDSAFRYLRESDLAEQIEQIKFMPIPLSTEDLSKIWSVFFQTPYALSIAYQASTVLIESDEIPKRALPVRQPRIQVVPYKPALTEIVTLDELAKIWRLSPERPILANSTIKIRGSGLKGDITHVQIAEIEVLPQEVGENEIILNLGSFPEDVLRPGIQSLQVIQRHSRDQQRIVESNVIPFVLSPTIRNLRIVEVQSGIEEDLREVELIISVTPTVGKTQRVALILNELSLENPEQYNIKIPNRPLDTDIMTVHLRDIKPGEYLVRIQIDGVESLLTVDTDAQSPTFEQYIAPKITIS